MECLLLFGTESFAFRFAIKKYKDYNTQSHHFAFVLYGCETRSLTLRESCRLSVFEHRVLRRIFGPKKDKVIGKWIKLHNKELNDLYSSHNII